MTTRTEFIHALGQARINDALETIAKDLEKQARIYSVTTQAEPYLRAAAEIRKYKR